MNTFYSPKRALFLLLLSSLVILNLSELKAENVILSQDSVLQKATAMEDSAAEYYLVESISNILFINPQKAKDYIDYYSVNLINSDSHRLCYTYVINGIINEMLGNYEEALKYDFMSVNLAEKLHDSAKIISGYINVSMVYFFYNNQYRKSIYYDRKALKIGLASKNYTEVSGCYSNIGGSYSKLNILDSSIYYQRKALYLRKKYGKNSKNDQRAIALIYSNIASNFFDLEIRDSAYYYKYESINLLNKHNFDFEVTEAYLGLSSFYQIDNEPDSAKIYILKAISIAKRLGLRNNLKNYYKFYADLLFESGDFKESYEYLYKHSLLSDTIHSEESQNKIAELQAQYDNEKNLRKIENLKFIAKKEKLRKIIYLNSFIAILLILSVILVLVLIKKRRDKIIANQKEELLHKENELSQIRQKELSTQLEYKNKQLTTHTLSMLKKNRFLQELDKDIRDLSKVVSTEHRSKLKRITTLIKYNSKSNNEWELFKSYFEDVNQDFYKKLSQKYPDLSPNDYKICALIRLNMNIKESASILNISPGSLKTSRYRLRRKLNLSPGEDLHSLIQAI